MKRKLMTAGLAALMGLTTVGAAAAQSYDSRDGYYYEQQRCHAKKSTNGTAGAVLGGIAGAILGSNVAHGGGRTGGAIIGGVAGAAVGSNVGRNGTNCDARGYYYNNTSPAGYYDRYGTYHYYNNNGYYYNNTSPSGYYDSYGTWHSYSNGYWSNGVWYPYD
jgi:hypothetical protein